MLKRIICVIGVERSESNFSLHVKESAEALGLRGIVFARPDGSIKIIAEGDEEALSKFVKKAGRSYSLFNMFTTIDNFFVKWDAPTGEYTDFRILDNKY